MSGVRVPSSPPGKTHSLACTCGWGGDYSGRETPVPIPNTVVKPSSSDDTAGAALWENRTLPLHPPAQAGFFVGLTFFSKESQCCLALLQKDNESLFVWELVSPHDTIPLQLMRTKCRCISFHTLANLSLCASCKCDSNHGWLTPCILRAPVNWPFGTTSGELGFSAGNHVG